ncbi:hypothetical protein BJF92_11200 [Rhizobium rhizosphaerae]|uniref:Uncharacterized protein n=1 Tax=Xaviernesmea rhizosphaerae TaxID=1672749 RepID=A0A1Q9AMM7_9HYPH|nr:hypothetical protein [Xaviernesmea rhizosphaerae]OLP56650.1 hypothetical protein BJF92_11200 [Xaviernesmea rhizosphaerae]
MSDTSALEIQRAIERLSALSPDDREAFNLAVTLATLLGLRRGLPDQQMLVALHAAMRHLRTRQSHEVH